MYTKTKLKIIKIYVIKKALLYKLLIVYTLILNSLNYQLCY